MKGATASLAWRGLGLLGCALLLWLSICVSLAARFGNSPSYRIALYWWPRDADALATAAAGQLTVDADQQRRANTRALAQAALRRSPFSVSAFRTLGLLAQMEGQEREASKLAGAADSLSRRDLATQLWLIQNCIARSDLDCALHHYDVALRTSDGSEAILFPILVNTLDDPAIRSRLVAILCQQPNWRPSFLDNSVRYTRSSDDVANLASDLAHAGSPMAPDFAAFLLYRLVNEGKVERAAQLYRFYRPGPALGDGPWPLDPHFTGRDRLGPFGWVTMDQGGAYAAFSADASGRPDRSNLAISLAPLAAGTVARQLLLLPPGPIAIVSHYRSSETGNTAPMRWRIVCGNSGTLVIDMPLPGAARSQSMSGIVPAVNCPTQSLELHVDGSDIVEPMTAEIDAVAVRREPKQ